MARNHEVRSASHALKSAAMWVGGISLAITALPALGIVAVFMGLFAPAVVPFLLVEGVSEAKFAHT